MIKRIIIIILVLIGIIGLNYHFFQEKMFFYGTGSTIPAFSNATWLMSEKEVERANKQKLILSIHDRRNLNEATLHVLNVVEAPNVVFNGIDFSIKYIFYKGQLIECEFTKKDIELEELRRLDSIMVIDLDKRYGNRSYGEIKTPNTYCVWDTGGTNIFYHSFDAIGRALKVSGRCEIVTTYGAYLSLTYKPYVDTLDILYNSKYK